MFERFPSLTRFSQGWSITEKIDGTNAQVFIYPTFKYDDKDYTNQVLFTHNGMYLFAGSRSRLITCNNDNAGFARWATENGEMLIETLDEGRHFGEWWGQGIQRNYGLKEKRFSLFNSLRWKQEDLPEGLYVVPILRGYDNQYLDGGPSEAAIDALEALRNYGSAAAPGFMDPEGIVMFHRASGTAFKKTFDYDEYGKWVENQDAKINT